MENMNIITVVDKITSCFWKILISKYSCLISPK